MKRFKTFVSEAAESHADGMVRNVFRHAGPRELLTQYSNVHPDQYHGRGSHLPKQNAEVMAKLKHHITTEHGEETLKHIDNAHHAHVAAIRAPRGEEQMKLERVYNHHRDLARKSSREFRKKHGKSTSHLIEPMY